jgi:polyisoprenoid-binding protein YceI
MADKRYPPFVFHQLNFSIEGATIFMRFSKMILLILLVSFVSTACQASSSSVAEAPATPTVAAEPTQPPIPTAVPPTPTVMAEPAQVAATDTPAAEPAQEPTPPPAEPLPTSILEAEISEAVARTFRLVPDSSQASYAVEEEFFNQAVDFFTAVGVTQAIEGEFTLNIEGSQVTLGENHFVVDLRTLTSDNSRRDNRIRQQWLESNTYPMAEFVATGLEDFPQEVAAGQDITFKVLGDMTIREVTKPVVFETTARLEGNTITGLSTTNILMRDFGFEPPSILGMLEVTDGVTVTVEFTAVEDNSPS